MVAARCELLHLRWFDSERGGNDNQPATLWNAVEGPLGDRVQSLGSTRMLQGLGAGSGGDVEGASTAFLSLHKQIVTTRPQCLDRTTKWAIHELKPLPFYTLDRVVLVGDAVCGLHRTVQSIPFMDYGQAHGMTPHQGAGAGQAIEV